MRSCITLVTCILLFAGTCSPAQTKRPTATQYAKHTFGKSSLIRAGAGAAIQQARNNPREWGGGVAGFGKRLASGFGEHVVKGTIEFGVATVRHEELGYRPSRKQGFGPRLKYALLSTVIARKTTTVKRPSPVDAYPARWGADSSPAYGCRPVSIRLRAALSPAGSC